MVYLLSSLLNLLSSQIHKCYCQGCLSDETSLFLTMNKVLYVIKLTFRRSLLFFGLVLLYGFTDFHAFFTIRKLQKDQYEIMIIELLLDVLLIYFLNWLYRHQIEQENPNGFARKPLTIRTVLLFFLGIICLIVYSQLWSFFGITSTKNQETMNMFLRSAPLLVYVVGILMAPIIEEFIFRGIFFNFFLHDSKPLSKVIVVLASGCVFGFLHEPRFDVSWLLYSIMGWIFGSVYIITKDLRYSIVLHMFNNAMAAVFPM